MNGTWSRQRSKMGSLPAGRILTITIWESPRGTAGERVQYIKVNGIPIEGNRSERVAQNVNK